MNRRQLWIAVEALVSVVLLTILLRSLDLAAFRALFVRLPIWFYLLSLVVVLGGQVAYAWRWRLLLVESGVCVPFRSIVRQYFIGIFLNNFFPSTVGGDVAKVYLLGRDHGFRVVAASVLLDRLLGLGLLAMWATLILWLLRLPGPALAAARLAVSGVAILSLVVLVLAAAGTGGLPAHVARLGPRAVSLAQRFQRFRFDMAAPLRSPVLMAWAALVVIAYALAAAAVYIGFIRIQSGAAPPFVVTTGVVMATAVLSNIPISLNGLGLREHLHALLLAPIGVPREVAVAISLLFFGHLLIGSLLGAMFWTRSRAVPGSATARAGT